MGSNTAVLVGCGEQKKDEAAPAPELYTSAYFNEKWAAGGELGDPYVVSGKYGLVREDEIIEPYSETWKNKSKEERLERAREVVEDLPDEYDEVLVLAGKTYRIPLIKMFEEHTDVDVSSPFAGTSGMPEQREWCRNVVEA